MGAEAAVPRRDDDDEDPCSLNDSPSLALANVSVSEAFSSKSLLDDLLLLLLLLVLREVASSS